MAIGNTDSSISLLRLDSNCTWLPTFLFKTISAKKQPLSCLPLMPMQYTNLLLGLHHSKCPKPKNASHVWRQRFAGYQLAGEYDVHPVVSGLQHRLKISDDTISESWHWIGSHPNMIKELCSWWIWVELSRLFHWILRVKMSQLLIGRMVQGLRHRDCNKCHGRRDMIFCCACAVWICSLIGNSWKPVGWQLRMLLLRGVPSNTTSFWGQHKHGTMWHLESLIEHV